MRRSDYRNRKEYRAAKHAAGLVRGPKGRPTPKNTPGCMTRDRANMLQTRRTERLLKNTAAGRAIETLLGIRRGEKEALERLQREAGGVILNPRK